MSTNLAYRLNDMSGSSSKKTPVLFLQSSAAFEMRVAFSGMLQLVTAFFFFACLLVALRCVEGGGSLRFNFGPDDEANDAVATVAASVAEDDVVPGEGGGGDGDDVGVDDGRGNGEEAALPRTRRPLVSCFFAGLPRLSGFGAGLPKNAATDGGAVPLFSYSFATDCNFVGRPMPERPPVLDMVLPRCTARRTTQLADLLGWMLASTSLWPGMNEINNPLVVY
jgi:hypothetical protein